MDHFRIIKQTKGFFCCVLGSRMALQELSLLQQLLQITRTVGRWCALLLALFSSVSCILSMFFFCCSRAMEINLTKSARKLITIKNSKFEWSWLLLLLDRHIHSQISCIWNLDMELRIMSTVANNASSWRECHMKFLFQLPRSLARAFRSSFLFLGIKTHIFWMTISCTNVLYGIYLSGILAGGEWDNHGEVRERDVDRKFIMNDMLINTATEMER